MGEERRCKVCDNPIDGDGIFCSNCRIKPREGITSSELKEKLRQGDIAMEKFSNMTKNDNLG